VYRGEHFNSVSPVFNFNDSFYIVKTDGTASHSQDIYDLVLNDQPIFNNNSTILIETSTVTMKDWTSKRCTNKYHNDWRYCNKYNAIDPSNINYHFGITPIYGTQALKCVDSPEYCK
jgi:hypothetical protein